MVELSHHGNFDIKVSGNILCATLLGSWNSQTAEAFSEQFMIQAVPLMGSSWGHLVLLDDWDLGVPETVPVIEHLVAWCLENGLTRAAHVYSPSMIKQYHLNKMVIEEIGVFQRNSFTQKTEAEAWLAASGFHLDTAYP
ncbi:MAG: hypothetical protein V7765_10860 [Oleispira sp.]